MKKIFGSIFIIFVVIIIIIMSTLLLSYNEYRVSEFGSKTLLIVDKKMHNFKSGSLLVVDEVDPEDVKEGDYIFYYDTSSSDVKTVLVQVKGMEKSVDADDIDYILPDDSKVNSAYLIGTSDSAKEYPKWGTVLGILESKWGNMFLVVVPAFLLFMYELFNVILEFKVYNMAGSRR